MCASTIACLGVAAGAQASNLNAVFSSKSHGLSAVDQNGVDLVTGQFVPPSAQASVGTADSGLRESIGGADFPNGSLNFGGITTSDPLEPGVFANTNNRSCLYASVFIGAYRKEFTYVPAPASLTGGHFESGGNADILDPGEGADMRYLCRSGMTLTMDDGSVAEFDGSWASDFVMDAKHGVLTKLTKPNGEVLTFAYNRRGDIPTNDPEYDQWPGASPEFFVEVTPVSVKSSLGWEMTGGAAQGYSGFHFINLASNTSTWSGVGASANYYGAGTQTFGNAPNVSFVTKQRISKGVTVDSDMGRYKIRQYVENRIGTHVTDNHFGNPAATLGRMNTNVMGDYVYDEGASSEVVWAYTLLEKQELIYENRTTVVDYYTPPDDYNKPYQMSGGCYGDWGVAGTCVKTVTRGGLVWKYTWSTNAVDIENPDHTHRYITTSFPDRMLGSHILSVRDELNRTTTYEYNSPGGHVTKAVYPEGNRDEFDYDPRDNLIQTRSYPKDGGAPIVQTANYDTTCTNLKTCNKPNWIVDARGNRTDYVYSPVHGGILSETGPADANGVRPQTRYEYTQLTPMPGTGAQPVWRLTKESTCVWAAPANPASCVGTSDEQVTLYAYDDPHLLLTTKTVKAGDNSISQTESYTYDVAGNVAAVDGPRTDVDDIRYMTYDTQRRPVFEIGVDPDGSGVLRRAAVQHLYDLDGNEYRTETGTCGTVTFAGSVPTGCSDFVIDTYAQKIFDTATGLPVKTIVAKP